MWAYDKGRMSAGHSRVPLMTWAQAGLPMACSKLEVFRFKGPESSLSPQKVASAPSLVWSLSVLSTFCLCLII